MASSCNYRIMTPWIVASMFNVILWYEGYATLKVILCVISWFWSFMHVKLTSSAIYEHHTLVMWDTVAIWLGSGDKMTFWFIRKLHTWWSQLELCYVIFVTKLTDLKYCRTKFTFSILISLTGSLLGEGLLLIPAIHPPPSGDSLILYTMLSCFLLSFQKLL